MFNVRAMLGMRKSLRRTTAFCLSLSMLLSSVAVASAESPGLSLAVKDPEADTYYVGQTVNVEVTAPEGADVYYTTDGTEPVVTSEQLTGNIITVTAQEPGKVTVKALAVVNPTEQPEQTEQPE